MLIDSIFFAMSSLLVDAGPQYAPATVGPVAKTFMEEYPFAFPFISAVLTIAGLIAGFLYFKRSLKEKHVQDQRTYQFQTDAVAVQKTKDDAFLAKELRVDSKDRAFEVKKEMVEHIGTVINALKQDLEIQRQQLITEVKLMENTEGQLRKDLESHVENQQTINEKMEKSINFVSQFLWGQGAKSIPPYLEGLVESQEHKDKAGEGIFMSPDSTETKVQKDKNVAAAAAADDDDDDDDDKKKENK